MKREYIKPTLMGIITLTENIMLDYASKSSIEDGNSTQNGVDNSQTGTIVDGAAKGYNPWTAWDD